MDNKEKTFLKSVVVNNLPAIIGMVVIFAVIFLTAFFVADIKDDTGSSLSDKNPLEAMQKESAAKSPATANQNQSAQQQMPAQQAKAPVNNVPQEIPQVQPKKESLDIDAELSAVDSGMSGLGKDDFNKSLLSDTEVGL